MNTIRHHHSHEHGQLDIRELANFDASLGDIPESDKRQKRIIYLRNALQQVKVGKKIMKGFGCLLIFFMFIPIFWPFLIFFLVMRKNASGLIDNQINNALDYWKIDKSEIFPGQTSQIYDSE